MRRVLACLVVCAVVLPGQATAAEMIARDFAGRWEARLERLSRSFHSPTEGPSNGPATASCAEAGLAALGPFARRWEARVGILAHNYGALTERHEDGFDVSVELLAPSPEFLEPILAPRPHLGMSVASDGVSQAYAGLTWDIRLFGPMFLSASFGAAVHNGDPLDGRDMPMPERDDHPFLGCRALFRGSLGIGIALSDAVSLEAYTDHASNGGLCAANAGLENTGIRLHYRF